MGLNIVLPGISVTYQNKRINTCLFILNCLLPELFLYKNEQYLKTPMIKTVSWPQ